MSTICTTTTLDCPTEVLIPWVSYHLNIGIDHMFLFFDNPNHPAIGTIGGHPRITAIRCDANYWPGGAAKREKLTLHERQWFNANNALQWARERGFDWIAHIDSDELLYYPGDLCQTLEVVPKSIELVRFHVYEAVPEALEYDHPFAGIRHFRVGPKRPTRKTWPRTLWQWMEVANNVSGYYARLVVAKLLCPGARGPFLRGHTGGKSAVRTSTPILGMGVHVPAPPVGYSYRDYFLPRGAVLHYDCADFNSWLAKWLGRAQERHVPRNRDAKRRRQLTQFCAAQRRSDPEALRDLYRRQYLLDPTQRRVLEALGLVVRVQLPAAAFVDAFFNKMTCQN